jgi:hypothetical protein
MLRNIPNVRLRILTALCLVSVFADKPIHSQQEPRNGQSVEVAALVSILNKMAEYCRKLQSAALDFICREEIREWIDPSLDSLLPDTSMVYSKPGATAYVTRWEKSGLSTYVYDYQCIRSGGKLKETRTLLEKNGIKKYERNAKLETSTFVYETALLGPVGLFGGWTRPDYDYKIAGHDLFQNQPVVIIEASPKPGAPGTKYLFGKAWVDAERGDILKIEWNDSRIGRLAIFKQRGKKYRMTPRITLRSEFSAEKNGLRFPSSLNIEEAYLDKKSRATVRSTMSVIYSDFKFFTVETESKIIIK